MQGRVLHFKGRFEAILADSRPQNVKKVLRMGFFGKTPGVNGLNIGLFICLFIYLLICIYVHVYIFPVPEMPQIEKHIALIDRPVEFQSNRHISSIETQLCSI